MKAADLARHAKAIGRAKPGRVRGALLDAGVDLAIAGFPREAMKLFDRALAAPRHPHESLYFEGAVVGLRVAMGLDDSAAARKAAGKADARVREDLLRDRWTQMKRPASKPGLPPAKLDALGVIEWFRRALFSDDEERRLAILRALLERPDLPPFFRGDSLLLVADALARAEDPAAPQALADWAAAERSLRERALALNSLARLIAAAASQTGPRDVQTFVAAALAEADRTRPDPASKYEVTTLYNQFYLEPKNPRPAKGQKYFDGPDDVKRGYSLRQHSVALSTPAESAACEVTLHVSPPPAKIRDADRVLSFPMQAAGDLYLRSVDDGSDDNRFSIPPGKYEFTVAFRRRKGSNPSDGLNRYEVEIWLAMI